MANFFFLLFAAFAVLGALAVVVNRHPVHSALCLLLSLLGLAGLFVQLDAALLAFVLLLVYAGAVVALFLFIIMLLDTRPSSFRAVRPRTLVAASLGGLLLLLGAAILAHRAVLPVAPATGAVPALRDYADLLFTTYLLPVEIVGFLLLAAMLGVIVLSRKFAEPGARSPNPGGNP